LTDYVPNTGDIVWVDFSPQAGSETAFRHPAVVLTVAAYSVATGLALVVPVTTKGKGGSFEVAIKAGRIHGYALANEIRTIDYLARNVEKEAVCPADTFVRIKAIAAALIEGQ
jgi:mRNA interferase MazF